MPITRHARCSQKIDYPVYLKDKLFYETMISIIYEILILSYSATKKCIFSRLVRVINLYDKNDEYMLDVIRIKMEMHNSVILHPFGR